MTATGAKIDPRIPTALEPGATVLKALSVEDRERITRLLTLPFELITNNAFEARGAMQEFFPETTDEAADTRPWCNTVMPAPVDAGGPVGFAGQTLTAAEEKSLFLRMNYARSRIKKILDRFAGRRLTKLATNEVLWWQHRVELVQNEIVQANMPLVLAMAKRTKLGNIDYAELISEGNMALLRSVDKFDVGRGFKFSTYACRAILKSFSRVAMKIARYRGRFPVEFDPTLERSDHLEQQRIEHETDCIDELRCIIRENTADLNQTEVTVLQARFALAKVQGLEGDGPKTLEQVGNLIGVTKERVRQIQNRALAKLRDKIQDDFLAA